MAEFCGFHGVSMMKNLLGKVSPQSTDLRFRHEPRGGHRAHEQARIKTKAANGSGRKARLYTGLGMRHRVFDEIDGASPSLTAARDPKLRIHGNSTWNVEEPQNRESHPSQRSVLGSFTPCPERRLTAAFG